MTRAMINRVMQRNNRVWDLELRKKYRCKLCQREE